MYLCKPVTPMFADEKLSYISQSIDPDRKNFFEIGIFSAVSNLLRYAHEI